MLENPKWEAFCLHYAKTGNASEAYRQAGYKTENPRSIYSNCNRLLKNDDIKGRIQEILEEMASEKIASIREVQERLTAILRGDCKEEQVVVEGCGDGVSEATIIKREVQMKDRIKAGELLVKMQGGFDSKLQVELTVPQFCGDSDLED